jgi:tRNA A37 threonylcarbamoyladenosine synthetase subunit TsaC/SUA5/YrdC
MNDPEEIEAEWGNEIDLILDSGILIGDYSTIADLTQDEAVILREGKGDISLIY